MAEHHGSRLRIAVGDMSFGEEPNHQFGIVLHVGDDMGEFVEYSSVGERWKEIARYVSHSLVVSIWRWGVYLSIRGRKCWERGE